MQTHLQDAHACCPTSCLRSADGSCVIRWSAVAVDGALDVDEGVALLVRWLLRVNRKPCLHSPANPGVPSFRLQAVNVTVLAPGLVRWVADGVMMRARSAEGHDATLGVVLMRQCSRCDNSNNCTGDQAKPQTGRNCNCSCCT